MKSSHHNVGTWNRLEESLNQKLGAATLQHAEPYGDRQYQYRTSCFLLEDRLIVHSEYDPASGALVPVDFSARAQTLVE